MVTFLSPAQMTCLLVGSEFWKTTLDDWDGRDTDTGSTMRDDEDPIINGSVDKLHETSDIHSNPPHIEYFPDCYKARKAF